MPAPVPADVRFFTDAAEFRVWLEEHHDRDSEVWVGIYKKDVPKTSVTYVEAVEEALCFGWIDGITRRVDEEAYTVRFTPRRRSSGWSAVNIARVAELEAAGRMQPAGVRAFEQRDRRKDAAYSHENARELPPEAEALLRADPAAWAYWQSSTPSYRRTATYWVMSAKREETRARRLATLVTDSAAGRRVKPLA
ncbi:MAG: YdeI/OmpD-associated family protein [Actinomycetota bacterium]|nr:YdeI/OmpD-associated family protein [Actinomycetota bacterium]